MRLLTVATDTEREGLDNLIYSAQRLGWELDVMLVPQWKGFGTKPISVYEYLKKNKDVDRFIFVDAYDVLALGTPKEFEEKLTNPEKMLLSVEVGCWPDTSLAGEYPQTKHKWKYINSGAYYSPSRLFVETFEANVPEYASDDQLWLSLSFLHGIRDKYVLDYNCDIFQSYSFIEDDDFSYENKRVQNLKTNTQPIFIHSNGRTEHQRVIDLIK